MLTIFVPEKEFWDSNLNEFYIVKGQELQLEHSLISVSKWESKWHIPFLVDDERTKKKFPKNQEMVIDYVRCMTVNKIPDDRIYKCITNDIMKKINAYISDPMTATTFSKKQAEGKETPINTSGTYTTAEIIYYQMYELGIPNEWEKRHLNRLLTLIKVMAEKKDPKKMSQSDMMKQNKALHAARRKPHVPRKR